MFAPPINSDNDQHADASRAERVHSKNLSRVVIGGALKHKQSIAQPIHDRQSIKPKSRAKPSRPSHRRHTTQTGSGMAAARAAHPRVS